MVELFYPRNEKAPWFWAWTIRIARLDFFGYSAMGAEGEELLTRLSRLEPPSPPHSLTVAI